VKTIELSEATGTLAEYAYQSLTGPVTFTLGGRPLAFIASAVGADEETIALSASRRLREIIERSRESYRRHGGISGAEIRRQVEQWETEERAAGKSGMELQTNSGVDAEPTTG
jgi:hypothetical protein